MPPSQRERMRADLKQYHIVGDRRITLHEGMVLDGWQLLQACIDEDIEPRFQELPKGMDPAKFVEIMNDHRRHEDVETIRFRAEKRREGVLALREHGKSERAIAEEVGTSKTQVHRDLTEAPGGPGGPPEPQDGKVTGKDGKTYSASQPKLIPELAQMGLSPKIIPALEALPRGKQQDFARLVRGGMAVRAALKAVEDEREPGDESTPSPANPSANGRAASRSALEPFNVAKFEEQDSLIRQLEKGIDELSRMPGGELLRAFLQATGAEGQTRNLSPHLEALKRDLANTRPHRTCPYCAGQPPKHCSKCDGHRWVTQITWRDAPEDVKARIG